MKKEKKLWKILLVSIGSCIFIIAICGMVTFHFNKESKKLDKESEKLNTFLVKTKSGIEIETEYTHVEDADGFYVKIPKEFKQLSYDDITKKYSGSVPQIVFSNDSMSINIAISTTNNKMKDSEINQYRKYMETILQSSSEIIDTKSYKVDGHTIGQLKLMTKAEDTEIFNNMLFFSYHDKLVIVTFNCTATLKEEWEKVGDFIIDSLFFKE